MLRVSMLNWLLKPKLRDGELAKSAIGEVVALQTILITEALALLGYVYVQSNAVPQWHVALYYSGLSVLPLLGMLLILCLHSDAHTKTPAVDRSTFMFARWSFLISLAMVGVMTALCVLGLLPRRPTCTRVRLTVDKVLDYAYELPQYKDKPGLIAYIPINRQSFPNGIPRVVSLQVALAFDLAKNWELTGTYGLQGPKLHSGSQHPATYLIDGNRTDIQRAEIDDLDNNGPYVLEIPLVGRTKTSRAESAKTLIMNQRQLTVTADSTLP